jgi:DNA modification methylase
VPLLWFRFKAVGPRNLNRRFLGIELSKQYFDLAEEQLR